MSCSKKKARPHRPLGDRGPRTRELRPPSRFARAGHPGGGRLVRGRTLLGAAAPSERQPEVPAQTRLKWRGSTITRGVHSDATQVPARGPARAWELCEDVDPAAERARDSRAEGPARAAWTCPRVSPEEPCGEVRRVRSRRLEAGCCRGGRSPVTAEARGREDRSSAPSRSARRSPDSCPERSASSSRWAADRPLATARRFERPRRRPDRRRSESNGVTPRPEESLPRLAPQPVDERRAARTAAASVDR